MDGSVGNPKFVTAGGMGTAMQLTPPFDFDGVTLRIFPLRANHYRLQRFVDRYLNRVPPQVARFRVPIPFAYLMLINYGKMSVDAANLGWISQLELLFCVPMEWYRLGPDGKYQFVDWAFVSPFIYVDNELSMTTGREVYGWPKSLAVMDAQLTNWMDDPRANPVLASAKTMLFPTAYRGMRQEPRTFLSVVQQAAPSPSQFLPDMESAFLPWVALPQAIRSSAALTRDWASILTTMGVLRKQPMVDAAAYKAMGSTLLREVDPRHPQLAFNTINLKQFRSADSPSAACYQALTNAKMELKRFSRAGLLGDGRMMLGDPSGGFRIQLHQYAATPIVDALGLEIESQWRGPGGIVTQHAPVLPYWMDVDMRYNAGETLTWRTKSCRAWTVGVGDDARSYARDLPADVRGDLPEDACQTPYNTTTGAASPEISGPFDFPDTTLRVLPLLADRAKLTALCKAYLNDPLASEDMYFEPWGDAVYLVAANHNGVSSDVNDIGWWADRDVTFYVPVLWYAVDDDAARDEHGVPAENARRLRSVALVPIFSYANSTTAAITSSEVSGTPVMKAAIDAPPGTWLAPGGPGDATTQPLLRLSTTVLPVLGEGQGAEERLLVSIEDGSVLPSYEKADWRRITETWGKTVKEDLASMWRAKAEHPDDAEAGLSLALELLANKLPFNILTLKQFRDTGRPLEACYQSYVLLTRQIERVLDVREIESRINVCIHDYPTQPIVETLGLIPKHVSFGGGARAFTFEPLRPFWMRVALRENLGQTVCRRAGTETWSPDPDTDQARTAHYFLGEHPGKANESTLAGVPRDLGDRVAPQRLAAQTSGVVPPPVMHHEAADTPLPVAEAARAIQHLTPQMIVSTVLSREWENWGTPRWQREREALAQSLADATRDALPEEKPEKITAYLKGLVALADQAERDAHGAIVSRTRRRADLRDALVQQAEIMKRMALTDRAAATRGNTTVTPEVLDLAVVIAKDAELYEAAMRALATIDQVEGEALLGERPDAGARFDELVGHELPDGDPLARARERARLLVAAIWSKPMDIRLRLRSLLIEHVTAGFHACVDALLTELSLCAQKPDFCLSPDTLTPPDRDAFFPREECWTRVREPGRFYVGAEARRRATRAYVPAEPESPSQTFLPLGDAEAPFDDGPRARELGSIRAVTVWSGDVVDAIRVTYDGTTLDKHGGSGGSPRTYDFPASDPLVTVVVHYGDYFGAEHVLAVELVPRSKVGAARKPAPAGARTVTLSAVDIARSAGAEIGGFCGASFRHTDGSVMLSRLDVMAVV